MPKLSIFAKFQYFNKKNESSVGASPAMLAAAADDDNVADNLPEIPSNVVGKPKQSSFGGLKLSIFGRAKQSVFGGAQKGTEKPKASIFGRAKQSIFGDKSQTTERKSAFQKGYSIIDSIAKSIGGGYQPKQEEEEEEEEDDDDDDDDDDDYASHIMDKAGFRDAVHHRGMKDRASVVHQAAPIDPQTRWQKSFKKVKLGLMATGSIKKAAVDSRNSKDNNLKSKLSNLVNRFAGALDSYSSQAMSFHNKTEADVIASMQGGKKKGASIGQKNKPGSSNKAPKSKIVRASRVVIAGEVGYLPQNAVDEEDLNSVGEVGGSKEAPGKVMKPGSAGGVQATVETGKARMMRAKLRSSADIRKGILRWWVLLGFSGYKPPKETAAAAMGKKGSMGKGTKKPKSAAKKGAQKEFTNPITIFTSDANFLSEHEEGEISRNEYVTMCVEIWKVVGDDEEMSVGELKKAARQDWKEDAQGKNFMDFRAFFSAIFQLCDLYTTSCEEIEYIEWLRICLESILHNRSNTPIVEHDQMRAPGVAKPEPKEKLKSSSKKYELASSGSGKIQLKPLKQPPSVEREDADTVQEIPGSPKGRTKKSSIITKLTDDDLRNVPDLGNFLKETKPYVPGERPTPRTIKQPSFKAEKVEPRFAPPGLMASISGYTNLNLVPELRAGDLHI